MRPRLVAELARLREVYGEVEHRESDGEDWFKIPAYALPEGWGASDGNAGVTIVFPVKADYPAGSPYGFLAPTDLRFEGVEPANTGDAPATVPFEGDWMFFSWHCDDWPGRDESQGGPDLVSWARSFANRFREGA